VVHAAGDAATLLEGKPPLLKTLELLPVLGTGLNLGEALDVCLPSVFGTDCFRS
jgi:hypothetical protein